ncbi:hypothetical protein [Intrasporangium oryzae]|uniref:hypothetical protein n=1 Tax=Intrasporangium oryzae TaxID=412687 RepID=UPI0004B2779A|nr:hypothetical protein [Intrasporangium oryzae]
MIRRGQTLAARSLTADEWALLGALAFAGVVLIPPLGAVPLVIAAVLSRRKGLRAWVPAALLVAAAFVAGYFVLSAPGFTA